MGIAKQGEIKQIQGAEGQSFDVYNGDWEALQAATIKWGLKDEASTLRFALAVLTIADKGRLSANGETTNPSDALLKGENGNVEK